MQSQPPGAAEKRLEQLGQVLSRKRRLLILTHDNPDPDSIAAGWALQRVVRKLKRIQAEALLLRKPFSMEDLVRIVGQMLKAEKAP